MVVHIVIFMGHIQNGTVKILCRKQANLISLSPKLPKVCQKFRVVKLSPPALLPIFFIPEADEWRAEAWAMIKERSDLEFLILTKRIDRFEVSLPADWGDGYDNVNIGCTVENQELTDYRLPLFLSYTIKRRFIACSPILSAIDLSPYLSGVEHVTVGGETGREARECDYDGILDIREQCVKAGITFWFKNTGSFFKCEGVVQKVNPFKQSSLAKEMGINIMGDKKLF